jgi:hypothetical protein
MSLGLEDETDGRRRAVAITLRLIRCVDRSIGGSC